MKPRLLYRLQKQRAVLIQSAMRRSFLTSPVRTWRKRKVSHLECSTQRSQQSFVEPSLPMLYSPNVIRQSSGILTETDTYLFQFYYVLFPKNSNRSGSLHPLFSRMSLSFNKQLLLCFMQGSVFPFSNSSLHFLPMSLNGSS